ncbi:TlpA family protein disulfide reductase [Brevundimonas variabilis]|uniref:Thiol-disulfide isomerase/thioredoxin n=1 Tax=Brevundimonas variabilis TaxID=74312 RepID=A0A7W9CGE0_9CAUL|nr:TlpA disulfide reductase family protein [Brevundimonas variabilis]MBB5745140.1 thiol-disulfide isomerase/thioredoxin [Brevundimonas variabilis]
MGSSKKTVWAGVAALAVAAVAAAAWFYAQQTGAGKDSGDDVRRFATGELAELAIPDAAEAATDHPFLARDGTGTRLSDFRGKVVVVNLWATWCAPCLAEMPTLAALSRHYGDNPEVLVLPVSVDVVDQREKAVAFIDSQPPLPFYNDPAFQLPFAFEGRGGMPQTILLDREGRVRATLTGGADWSGPDARALVDALLAEPAGMPSKPED